MHRMRSPGERTACGVNRVEETGAVVVDELGLTIHRNSIVLLDSQSHRMRCHPLGCVTGSTEGVKKGTSCILWEMSNHNVQALGEPCGGKCAAFVKNGELVERHAPRTEIDYCCSPNRSPFPDYSRSSRNLRARCIVM